MKYILVVNMVKGKPVPGMEYKADYNSRKMPVADLEELCKEWKDADDDGSWYMVTGEYDDHMDILLTMVKMPDGSVVRYEDAAMKMDSEIISEIVMNTETQDNGLIADPQAFLNEYAVRHAARHGERFRV